MSEHHNRPQNVYWEQNKGHNKVDSWQRLQAVYCGQYNPVREACDSTQQASAMKISREFAEHPNRSTNSLLTINIMIKPVNTNGLWHHADTASKDWWYRRAMDWFTTSMITAVTPMKRYCHGNTASIMPNTAESACWQNRLRIFIYICLCNYLQIKWNVWKQQLLIGCWSFT